MPFTDGTGPEGRGSMTGRRLGKCSPENDLKTNNVRTPYFGRRLGRGFGRRGFNHRFNRGFEEKNNTSFDKE